MNKLILVSTLPFSLFKLTYGEVDVYDFEKKKWEKLAEDQNLPTQGQVILP